MGGSSASLSRFYGIGQRDVIELFGQQDVVVHGVRQLRQIIVDLFDQQGQVVVGLRVGAMTPD
ncbi:MAG: hypothetical protein QM803_07325 [Rhodocyclaceae bacterium]